MILWLDGAHGARENMRRDTVLLEAAASGALRESVLRLFMFEPWGITLGRSQDAARELDLDRVESAGLEWAVRPTGGRAILHDEEWTFSLVTTLGSGGWARDADEAYARTCALLADALKHLGVPVELSPGSARGIGFPRERQGPAAPCFASTARHELTIEGRKFAGIAQRQVRDTLLQQGSLLTGDSHLELVEWQLHAPEARPEQRSKLLGRVSTARRWLGVRPPLDSLADALGVFLPGATRLEGEAGLIVLNLEERC